MDRLDKENVKYCSLSGVEKLRKLVKDEQKLTNKKMMVEFTDSTKTITTQVTIRGQNELKSVESFAKSDQMFIRNNSRTQKSKNEDIVDEIEITYEKNPPKKLLESK